MELKPLKPLLRGNFNCDFLGDICEGAVRKDEAVQWRSSGGGHWSLLGITLHQQKSTLLQQKDYSAAAAERHNVLCCGKSGFQPVAAAAARRFPDS